MDPLRKLLPELKEFQKAGGIILFGHGALTIDADKFNEFMKGYVRRDEVLPLLKQARAEYLEQHSDGETDCVTPYDHLFYGRD